MGLPEPEEADCEEEAADGHGHETCFGDWTTTVCVDDAGVARLVGEVYEDGAEDADEEGEEGEGGDDE